MNKGLSLFDPIINSEDEMILHAGLQNYKSYAYIYLRAYIMATLCFTKELVVTDTAVCLNRAFRTLIDKGEEGGNYFKDEKEPLLYRADFSWLIKNGYIRIAARDTFTGFSDLLKEQKDKRDVSLPSERYVEMMDNICPSQYMKTYSKDMAFFNFSSTCRDLINNEINNISTLPEREKILKELMLRLSGQETFTYNIAKNILLHDMKIAEKNPEYQFIRKILRQSYDYNVPNLLGLDYCMSFQNTQPSKKQEWELDLSCENLKCDFKCSVYGLAELPAYSLLYIWESKEGIDFFQRLEQIKHGTLELNEYVESLRNYLLIINDVVKDNYGVNSKNKNKVENFKAEFRRYFKTDGGLAIAAKTLDPIHNVSDDVIDVINFELLGIILKFTINKLIPCLVKKADSFPDPPEEITEAIVMKSRSEEDNN